MYQRILVYIAINNVYSSRSATTKTTGVVLVLVVVEREEE